MSTETELQQRVAAELKVPITFLAERTSADTAGTVKSVLAWNSTLPRGVVQVNVESGWATVTVW